MLRAAVAKLLNAKLITATAVVTVATGGVALAAATNTLPDQAQSVAHDLVNAPSPNEHSSAAQDAQEAKQAAATASAKSSAAPRATPSPSLRGLCTAYQAGATSNGGKAMSNPAFQALVTAAGGADDVAAYCTKLVGAPRTHPTGQPSADQPGGKPSTAPSAAPTSHPSGQPTALPTAGHPTSSPTTHPGSR